MVKRTFKKIAGRFIRRALPKLSNRAPETRVHGKLEVYLVSSWNTRCGIAAYSRMLADELKKRVNINVIDVSKNRAVSPFFFVLGYENGKKNQIVQVQFAYGMFPGFVQSRRWGFSDFGALLFYLGLAFSKSLVVTTFHEVKTKRNPSGKIKLVYEKLLDKLICNISDLIIVHTIESKEALIKNYGMNKERIKIVPMGCLQNPIINDKEKAKEKLQLTGKTVITVPGFISKNHGIDLVVSIMPHLEKEIVLLIAGGTRTKESEQYKEELKEIAKQNHIDERIFFVDEFPIPVTVFNATDIAILPYRCATESLSLRMLIAYGIPTIASDLNFFREIKQQYGCIETFEADNAKSLLSETLLLLADREKQNSLKDQCTEMWNQNKWSEIAKKYVEAYFESLSGHPDEIYDKEIQKERINWLKEKRQGSALEIGCAGGFITNYVNANAGLDINPWRIRFSKIKYPEKDFIIASAFMLPFKDKAFDSILIPEILEHVTFENAKIIVNESKRIAYEVLTTLPNADKINYDKTIVENPEHLWFPTKKLALQLMNNCTIQYSSKQDFILISCTE
jgi:glycosyltransferase involved in cell wall biosynthesis